jgi:hypothetical protein
LNSKDINLNLYGVYLIKKYLIKFNDNDKMIHLFLAQIDIEYMLLFISLLNKNNKKLSSEILYIFISISYPKNGEEIFLLDEKILLSISTFLGKNKNDSNLIKYGIWLIRNIIFNDKICDIFLNYNIIAFFEEIYERHLLDNDLMRQLILCIKKIISYKFDLYQNNKNIDILCLIPTIKIIKTQLKPNLPPNILSSNTYQLYYLALFKSSDIFYKMTEFKIHKEVMNLYPIIIQKSIEINNKLKEIESNESKNIIIFNNNEEKKQLKIDLENYINIEIYILKMLAKIISLEDGILTQILIDSGIAQFLNFVLQSDDPKIIKNACICISNICCGTCGQVGNLYENNTFIELIKVSKNIYEALVYNSKCKDEYYKCLIDTFREINYSFTFAIINSIYEKIIPLARYDNFFVVLLLIKGLDYLNDKKIDECIEFILKALYKLFIYDRDEIKKDGSNNNNNYINFAEFMEKNGLKESLEKLLSTNKNNRISFIAERVYNSIFNDFEKI